MPSDPMPVSPTLPSGKFIFRVDGDTITMTPSMRKCLSDFIKRRMTNNDQPALRALATKLNPPNTLIPE